MMNIKTRLTRCCGKPVGGYKCGDGIRCPDCFDKLQGWREIEELRNEVEKWKSLEREAATHVESVICMKSRHFTGEEPYVGWKGLGLALSQDYDDFERLREVLKRIPDELDDGNTIDVLMMIDTTLKESE